LHRVEVTYVTVRIEPTPRFDCSGPRILRSCVLAHSSATSQPEFPEPHRLCFCCLLCPWSGCVFLGEDFRFGSKEETLVQTRLPVCSVTNHYSGMRVVLGWRFYTRRTQSLDIRSPFYKISSFKARISEHQQCFTFRDRHSRHALRAAHSQTEFFPIAVENRDYHYQSHFEIAGAKRIYQHLSHTATLHEIVITAAHWLDRL
jgi:hypothetical protein